MPVAVLVAAFAITASAGSAFGNPLSPSMIAPLPLFAGGGRDVVASSVVDRPACLPMASLTSISFESGAMTMGRRRLPNGPTMTCVRNCPPHTLLGAQCVQTGMSDNGLPSWRCVGQFDGTQGQFGLGPVKVTCEGCARAGDPNVAQGSCELQYSVTQRRSAHDAHFRHHHSSVGTNVGAIDGGESVMTAAASAFVLLFVLGVCLVSCRRRQQLTYPYPYGTAAGAPPPSGYPAVYGAPVGAPYYGGGSSGPGLGTGLAMGYILGSSIGGGGTHNNYYYNSYGGGGGDDGASDGWGGGYYGGGDGGAGFGGSDSA